MFANKIILLFLFLPLVYLGCTKEVNSPNIKYGPKFSLQAADKILKINDSTTVYVEISTENDTYQAISWSSNTGSIVGFGNKIKYIAPDKKTSSFIKVSITDNNNNILTDSIKILIYKQLIFLKADDLVFDKDNIISPRWKVFIDFIRNQNIKASLGLIGTSLEYGNLQYYLYLKVLANCGNFEIWNHGYDHLLNGVNGNGEIYHEFWNTPFDYQKEHLLKTQNLAKEKLGIVLHTFGAPGNAIDNTTVDAINEIGEIKIWYFGLPDPSKLVLQRFAEIEFPTHNSDYQKFLNNYNPEKDYLAIQIHPNSWDENQFSEFKRVVEFLIEQNVTFINPYEYYCLKNLNDR